MLVFLDVVHVFLRFFKGFPRVWLGVPIFFRYMFWRFCIFVCFGFGDCPKPTQWVSDLFSAWLAPRSKAEFLEEKKLFTRGTGGVGKGFLGFDLYIYIPFLFQRFNGVLHIF